MRIEQKLCSEKKINSNDVQSVSNALICIDKGLQLEEFLSILSGLDIMIQLDSEQSENDTPATKSQFKVTKYYK